MSIAATSRNGQGPFSTPLTHTVLEKHKSQSVDKGKYRGGHLIIGIDLAEYRVSIGREALLTEVICGMTRLFTCIH